MKRKRKISALLGMIGLALALNTSVSGQYWNYGGDVVPTGSFIGTLNNEPLIFRTGAGGSNQERMRITPQGALGIGTNMPLSRFHFAMGGLLMDSPDGPTPTQNGLQLGGGTRLMWVPDKRAFRVGEVNSTQWDDFHLGMNSVAMGKDVMAHGIGSMALGTNVSAGSDYSVGLGHSNTLGGNYAVAIGYHADAFAANSVAIGSNVIANNNNAFVIGSGLSPTSKLLNYTENSLAIGFNSDVPTLFVGPSAGTAGSTGNIGVGTHAPDAKFHLIGGSVIFEGTGGVNPTVSGAGTRMMWVANKGAFRSGYVTGSQWDYANIGSNSVGMGPSTIASGSSAVALGASAEASGTNSMALGLFAKSTGYNSVAVGYYAEVTSVSAIALGNHAKATGNAAASVGRLSEATGVYSNAFGTEAKSTGDNSTALGNNSTASGAYALTVGRDVTASASDAIVIGRGLSNANANTISMGMSSASGQVSTPTLFLEGSNLGAGNVGVGTDAPQGMLDVNSGGLPNHALFVKTNAFVPNQGGIIHHQGNQYAWQEVTGGTSTQTSGSLRYHYVDRANPSTKEQLDVLVMKSNGQVGIGTSDDGARLMVRSSEPNENILLLRRQDGGFNGTRATFRIGEGTGTNSIKGMYLDMTGNGSTYTNALFLAEDGRVGIGTDEPSPDAQLSVKGKVLATSFRVRPFNDWFPDFVFESNYQLRSLGEVEAYIASNGHLPEIPSACEVEEQGVDLFEMNRLLLLKVEEMTLYMIQLEKDIAALKAAQL